MVLGFKNFRKNPCNGKFFSFILSRNFSTQRQQTIWRAKNVSYLIASGVVFGGLCSYSGKLISRNSSTKLKDLRPPRYASETEFDLAVNKIKLIVGEKNVTNSIVDINHHSTNEFTTITPGRSQKPKCVVYPESTEEISKIMKVVFEYNVPVVPYSGGTSLEGHFHSTRPGILLSLKRMNKILAVHEDDLDAVVQGGVGWVELNNYLEPSGLMLGCDCGTGAQISGMINTNASGLNASRYGAMKENVIGLTVVLADGTIIKTKKRPRKSSAGYNLTGIFIGSEGTLGIVTEATVKLHVRPKYETVAVAQFQDISDTTNTVTSILRSGIQVQLVELMDKNMMKFVNYSDLTTRKWQETPTLFLKVGGLNQIVVNEYIKKIKNITQMNNCKDFIFANNKEEGEELFAVRKGAFYAMLDYGYNEIDENIKLWVTDIAVPLSKLSSVLKTIDGYFEESGFQTAILGHVGDSNFHADIYYKEDEFEKCQDLVTRMIKLGLSNEGTCTGEHGIGIGKRNFLEIELGEDAINLMRKLKLALDPKRLLNPDKVFKIDPNDMGQS
ncbi:hypothetical protein PACTADRAFT_85765 [Pachysolen tannophilus NRRL Y-2460]|uniref:D-lactate dehydrogenase (cytochrome) n=1 Tax=Pachysolen tannophilus NRRL Y-2460 TaxID=669874 RepID=A0A1E4TVD2_PACTA|nr:hypothetical protein PACTADRAFT_85765 [Pachysolen tannophilus NRRL Y-2460]